MARGVTISNEQGQPSSADDYQQYLHAFLVDLVNTDQEKVNQQ